MTDFADTYLGQLRSILGHQLLLVPGARVVVEDQHGRVLLQKRSDFGVWGLPGGNAEPGESLEEVAAREVAEETGLAVSDLVPFGFASDPSHERVEFPNGDVCQFFVLMFVTNKFHGQEQVKDEESIDLGWFSYDKLPPLLPNMSRSIDALRRFKTDKRFQLI